MALSLHLWITFILTLTVGSGANEGNGWAVYVKRHIDALRGSDVVIQCKFTHPSKLSNDAKVFWKKDEKKGKGQKRETNNPFVFHPDSSKIIQTYSGRTSLVGDVLNGDCSLQIKNITHDESDLYVRVYSGDYYSFYTYTVSIKITAGTTRKAVTIRPALEVTEEAFRTLPHATSSTAFISQTESLHLVPTQSSVFPLHLVISVPIASVFTVGIVVVIVILVYRKRGRSQSLNRTTSGYYANFSLSEKKTKSFPQDPQELNAIEDEPVYNNLQELTSCQPSATSEMEENIYANM